jgi:hypothetical protein
MDACFQEAQRVIGSVPGEPPPLISHARHGCVSFPSFFQLHDNFYSVFGVEKARRIGSITWEERRYMLNMIDDGITEQTLHLLASGRTAQVWR